MRERCDASRLTPRPLAGRSATASTGSSSDTIGPIRPHGFAPLAHLPWPTLLATRRRARACCDTLRSRRPPAPRPATCPRRPRTAPAHRVAVNQQPQWRNRTISRLATPVPELILLTIAPRFDTSTSRSTNRAKCPSANQSSILCQYVASAGSRLPTGSKGVHVSHVSGSHPHLDTGRSRSQDFENAR